MSKPRLKKRIARLRRKIFPVKVKPDPHFQTIESPQINPNLVISDRELADYEFNILSYIYSHCENHLDDDPSHLFDIDYYTNEYPDVLRAKLNPLNHYCEHGWREGRNPNAYFNSRFYLGQMNDRKLNPLLHYIIKGKKSGLLPKPLADEYLNWIHFKECELPQLLANASSVINSWPREKRPLFSIILPVYNTDEDLLERAIATVIGQVYSHWELCISDDASTTPHIRPLLQRWAQKDPRIKIHFCEENGHISANSNSALDMATGGYCVLMDHDDELRPHSLFEVAKVIMKKPETIFIYSDEDKIDREGNRKDPHFKSSWNPDLFHAQNYLNHLTVLKTSRLREIGGWRIGYEGSQDHELYLRFLHDVDANQITHIPKILYHWRAVAGSAAMNPSEKDYAHAAGIRALNDYFNTVDSKIKVCDSDGAHCYRIVYPLPKTPPLVSLIIPMRDLAEITQACVESILEKTDYPNYEILIVNNNSEEEKTYTFLSDIQRNSSRVRVIDYIKPFNYSAINNYAVDCARGEIVGLVNNDIEIINEGWLTELVSHVMRDEVGCVGAKLYYPDNSIQHAGIILGLHGLAGHSHKNTPRKDPGYFRRLQVTQAISAVTAAMLLVKKSLYKDVGGLNDDNLKVAFNDVDFCLRVSNKGYRNIWTPYAEAYHHESKSRGDDHSGGKLKRFRSEVRYMHETWGDVLKLDPYHSPNLKKNKDNFTF
jgi:glycosyltransferase involved in cell wall biosynthesis